MKSFLLTVACLSLVGCGQDASLTGPTGSAATARSIAAAAPGDPNHFDPDPIRGFDSAKWHDLKYTSQKYEFGRALLGLAVTGENLKRTAERYGFLYLGKDLIAAPDGVVIDCIYDFDGPRARWQWQLSH